MLTQLQRLFQNREKFVLVDHSCTERSLWTRTENKVLTHEVFTFCSENEIQFTYRIYEDMTCEYVNGERHKFPEFFTEKCIMKEYRNYVIIDSYAAFMTLLL